MPVISAFADHPTHPYIRVEINWADIPSVEYARVLRVSTVTGECVALRPYICYQGDYLLLSCGHGTFWDTEVPFDTPVYYITEGLDAPCLDPDPIVFDLFEPRVTAASWGSASETGQPWTIGGGPAADYLVTGGTGRHSVSAVTSTRHTRIDAGVANMTVLSLLKPGVLATGAAINMVVAGRYTDETNHARLDVDFQTTGEVTTRLRRVLGGAFTDTASVTLPFTYSATSEVWAYLEVNGNSMRGKVWQGGTPPTEWTIQDLTLATGLPAGTQADLRSFLNAGNTNTLPVVTEFDFFQVGAPCVPCTTVTATSGTLTIANDGRFWLKDPVRPCNDRPVPLCQTGSPLLPECGGSGGILFVGMGPEIYSNNSFTLRPMNRRRTMSVTRPRSDATTSLRLQTLTFTDRDDLLALTEPGSLLLWQGPAEYGIPDRYMSVQPVQVQPELPDLRIQIRTETLPYLTEDRPAGPTQGICGARVADICDQYATWDELAETGLTWDDLVAGQASPVSANPDRRTWDDVNAEFADWDAVNTGGRTWDGLEEGL